MGLGPPLRDSGMGLGPEAVERILTGGDGGGSRPHSRSGGLEEGGQVGWNILGCMGGQQQEVATGSKRQPQVFDYRWAYLP